MLGFSDLLEIFTGSESLKGGKKGFGVWEGKVIKNKWEFWNTVDSVSSGHDEWSTSRSSEGRSDSMSSLGDVSLSVPFSPDLKWSEHSSLSAHVTEGSLSRSVGTRSRNSWNSCYGSTSSPGFGRVLLTSLVENGVTLSSVLSKVGVDEVN